MRLPAPLRHSIRSKLTALVVATTLAALGVSGIILSLYNVREYRETTLAEVRTQAAIVGRASAPALTFNDARVASRDLAMLDARPDVEQAALYTAQGNLFAAYARNGETAAVPPTLGAWRPGIEEERLTTVYPIIEDHEKVGTVVLVTHYGLRARFAAYVLILAAGMTGAMLAALLLSAWLQRAVTTPILRVAGAARAVVERRDFSVRVRRTTEDEIGMLADAMNRMLEDLEREIEERREAEAALRAVDRRKDEFLAMLAHELRNPLAPARNAVEIMRRVGPDDERKNWARDVIDRQLVRLSRLVDDLLDVARIKTQKVKLQRAPVDLRSVIDWAVEGSRPLMEERGHKLVIDFDGAPIVVDGDLIRLAQAIGNLLDNAAKYTQEPGEISLRVEHEGDMVAIRVADPGIGISSDALPRIFDLFTQESSALDRSLGGLGIGLSLVRQLVEMHGGTVEAASRGLGRGSVFTIRLPVLSAPGVAGHAPHPRPESPAAPARRVLVVDDNEDSADSASLILKLDGHDVRTAYTADDAIAIANAFAPQVVVLDLGIPGKDGFEIARQLRADPGGQRIRLVAMTGYGQPDDQRRTREAGFDFHLTKPIVPEMLREIVAREMR